MARSRRVLGRPLVDTALEDLQRAELPARLRAALAFLEVVTRTPDTLTAEDARTVLREGVPPQALEDAIAVAALFNVIGRCADALDYDVPGDRDFDRAAKRLLAQGYAFGKGKHPVHADHRALADAVRRRVLEGPGETAAALRHAMAERAAGGPPLEAPYDDLARQIGQAAHRLVGMGQARSVTSRVRSAQLSSATEARPRTGCSGAHTVSAPETPSSSTTSLLQTGQPIARADSSPPPAVLERPAGWAGERT